MTITKHRNDVVAAPLGTDEEIVNRFGYKQELRRKLRFFSIFAMAFSMISITTGIFLNFAFGLEYFGPAMIWIWPVVVCGNFLIALVVAELGTRIPLAGYAYQWSARLVNPHYGWFVGWFGLIFMLCGSGAIALYGTTLYFLELFTSNASPHLTLAVCIMIMILPVVINIISVQLAARVNNIAVFTEILGTVAFAVVLIVLWGLRAPSTSHSGASILFNTTTVVHHALWYSIALASLVGVYTVVGFELCADLSEEAIDAGATVPKAVLWSVIISGCLGMVALVGFALAIPSLHAIEGSEAPLVNIAQFWLGTVLTKVMVALVVFSMFALSVMALAAEARLVYSLARDNMLPWSKALRKVNAKTQTPIVALVVFGLLNICVMMYGYLQPNAFGTLVGANAIVPYIIYFLTIVAYMFKRETMESVPGQFNLGRWSRPVIYATLVWTVLVLACLMLPSVFHGADRVVAILVVLGAIWYFGVLRFRLKKGIAGPASIEQVMAQENPGAGGESALVK